MDDTTCVQVLKDEVRAFCEARDWDQFHTEKNLAIGLVTEAAELLQHFRFLSDDEAAELAASPDKQTEIREELSDIVFFALRFAQRLDLDVTTSLREKIAKNSQKYPISKAKGSNRKYTEL